ncbi:30S ribosomal protein S20 [Candidatus Hydrogenisulfobacillus filiaventi]|uniref:Small ribosomal subunit protein bS20 n=1 Tax=Candidatus Hydrogenisulfobacillus filiaventi TaxID=2707344 RepID=A0A6F8ZI70_9FIRM|nr:30S ribosomal protein S20 [Bacillota bacterium]CAB1129642.1 30S ribosomal protein S20 [Candidatus Hydrogenisulfobacillus filiaventi]
MAHSKSAKKRIRITRVRTARNRLRKTLFRAAIRRFRDVLKTGDLEQAEAALRFAYSRLDRAAQKGAIHRNAAARKKARLTALLNEARRSARQAG